MVAMYLLISFALMEKLIQFYTKNLPKHAMTKINLCLRIIGFGMISTLLSFQEKYYEYWDGGLEKKILEMGGYESALLAELVATYPLEVTKNQFK